MFENPHRPHEPFGHAGQGGFQKHQRIVEEQQKRVRDENRRQREIMHELERSRKHQEKVYEDLRRQSVPNNAPPNHVHAGTPPANRRVEHAQNRLQEELEKQRRALEDQRRAIADRLRDELERLEHHAREAFDRSVRHVQELSERTAADAKEMFENNQAIAEESRRRAQWDAWHTNTQAQEIGERNRWDSEFHSSQRPRQIRTETSSTTSADEREERERRRIDSIIANTPAKWEIDDANPPRSRDRPFWYRPRMEEVTQHDRLIKDAARKYGIYPDLIRAVMWIETTHGWYDKYPGVRQIRRSVGPMNIGVSTWERLGFSRSELEQPHINVDVGARILSGIWNRVENPTVEKVASVYNPTFATRVNSYGTTVANYYRSKPWLNRSSERTPSLRTLKRLFGINPR